MESLVELLAAISAEESSGSDTPSTEPGSGHANVSGSVRLVVTETDTTGCASQHISTPTHSAEAEPH